MRKYSKWFLGILLVLLILEIVILAPKTLNKSPSIVADDINESHVNSDKVEQLMQGVHSVGTKDGNKDWELWADEALDFKTETQWTLENVKAIFFGNDGVYFTVTGKQGFVEPETKNMEVKGDVVTRSSNGYVFKTEKVSYTSGDRSLVSDDPISMVGPKDKNGNPLRLNGVGIKADLNESTMKVQSQVVARKTFVKGQKAKIRSNTALFSGKSQKAFFSGDVVIDFDNMRLTGPEAEFDYDQKKGVVKTMFVKNGVRVSDDVKYGTSDNVRVLFEEEKFVFRGAPRVVQNNDELRGEEIVFLNRGETVKVMKARARVEEVEDQKKAGEK
ncbi:MAG: LPS export ABC transporter periplasmic protein LptC [Bdellovibrionales bacterium]|nr:LPS export ABC transporter periplasmic protein LptC [Bdellovibrionales bacterium]